MFTSDFYMQGFKKLETTLSTSSKNHPRSNGQIECVDQIITDMLEVCVTNKPKEWE